MTAQAGAVGSPFDFLYAGKRSNLNVPNYSPPVQFPHGQDVLVAECPKAPEDGDGQSVRVYECRWPAIFFRIEAAPDPSSTGRQQQAFTISTGSGQQALVAALVEAITTGMIGVEATPPAAVPVEALEGLVEALRNEAATIAKPYGFVTEHIIGKAEGLESCAERIERLIKERSNGS